MVIQNYVRIGVLLAVWCAVAASIFFRGARQIDALEDDAETDLLV